MTLIDQPSKSVLEQANAAFIRYPRLNELHKEAMRCQCTSKIAGEPQCMAVEGPTGAGKTTLFKWYASQFPRRETETGTIVPVFYMETPSPATVKVMASAMLEKLGDQEAYSGTIGPINSRLIKWVRDCQVELVILDDFRHLIDTETDRVLAKVSDWLKVLIKETGIPYLVVGIEGKVEHILQANPQLSRLFATRETLAPFQWNNARPATIQEFSRFALAAEKSMGKPLDRATPRTEMLYRLYYATDGVVGNVMNLMRYAVMLAEEQSLPALGMPLLAEAFDKRLAKHLVGKVNPFTASTQEPFSAPAAPPESQPRAKNRRKSPSITETLSAR